MEEDINISEMQKTANALYLKFREVSDGEQLVAVVTASLMMANHMLHFSNNPDVALEAFIKSLRQQYNETRAMVAVSELIKN